jgi:hypothetical protein
MALLCKIELSQIEGITVTVFNKDGKITQTAVFNGTSMVHTCKGETDTSIITQTCDSVTVKCKNFTVDAETILCKSSKNTDHQAQGTFTVDSTGKATFKSSADMDVSATSNLKMNSANFSSEATSSAKLTAMNTTINGDTKACVTGLALEFTAKANAKLEGAMVKLAAQAVMNVEGGATTTVKGGITNIQGGLVKIG